MSAMVTLFLTFIFQTYGFSSGPAVPVSLPVVFETNKGQAPPAYRFLSRHGTVEALFSSSGVDLVLPENEHRQVQIAFRLLGAEPNIVPEGRNRLPSVSHYLLGNDPSRWIRDVPNDGEVLYRGIYPGIDLIFHGMGENMEHDFRIAPNGNPDQVRFLIQGEHEITLDPLGNIKLSLLNGTLLFRKPKAYQDSSHGRETVESSFVVNSDNSVGFRIGRYDRSRELVIDPVFVFSTYLAGSNSDTPAAVATDSNGNVYVAGYTSSTDFPTRSGLQVAFTGSPDGFVSKLDATGHTLLYSTYLGGSSANYAGAIAIDSKGNVIVAGTSSSNDFPHAGSVPALACQTNDQCFFVASLTPDGRAFNYVGLIGGIEGISASYDPGNRGRIAIDSSGNVYLAGVTDDPHFELTPGTLATTVPGYPYDSTFVLKASPIGALVYSTIIPGTEPENAVTYLNNVFLPAGISVDINGQATIAGTAGPGLPSTPGVIQPTFPNAPSGSASAGFILQLNDKASAISYATYVPGTDTVGGFAVDSSGDSYLAGGTSETNLPVSSNAYQKNIKVGQNSGFLVELDGVGKNVSAATYLGGTGNARTAFTGIALDGHSNVYVGGSTGSSDFPLQNPFTSLWEYTGTSAEMVLAGLKPDLSSLLFGSFLSSTDPVYGGSTFAALAVDGHDNLIVVGQTNTTDFPTTAGSFQPGPPTQFFSHGFIAKLDMTTPAPSVCLDSWNVNFGSVPPQQSSTQTVHLTNCGNAPLSVASIVSSTATVVVADNCTTVAAGSVCPITLTFNPVDSSMVVANLTLKDNAVISPQVVQVSGQGVGPKLVPSSGSFDFGHLLVNTTGASTPLLFSNRGNAPISFTSASVTGDFSIDRNTCLGTLPANSYCSIFVTFSPTAAGVRTGTLTLISNDPVTPQAQFTLQGTADTTYSVPAIASLDSQTAQINNGPISVQVTGVNFYPASVIEVNGKPQPTKYSSGQQLQATLDSAVTGAIGELSVSVFTPTPGGGTSPSIPLTLYEEINVGAAFLTNVPGSNLLYASIPSSAAVNPNTVISIDPATGALGTPISVGHDPGLLAPSSDGSYLFVVANQDQEVQRINLATHAVDRTFPFPPNGTVCCGALSGTDLKGVPGMPQEVVLALDILGYGFAEMALYNDSGLVDYVPTTSVSTASFWSFAYVDNPLTIYSLPFTNAQNSFFNIVTINSQGLQFTPYDGGNYVGNNTTGRQVVSDGSLLYTNSGEVWNPTTQTEVGTFPVTAYYYYPDNLNIDLRAGRLFLIAFQPYAVDSNSSVLSAYDLKSLSLTGSLAFPGIIPPNINCLMRWGPNGFAFLAQGSPGNSQAVFILTSNLASTGTSNPLPQLVSLSPSSIPQGSSGFTLTLNGQGFNQDSVVKWNSTPLTTTYSGSVLTAFVPTPDLANSGTASVTVTNPAPGGGDSNSLTFTISPLAPLASLSSSSLVFADQEIATPSGVQTIALQNTGNGTLAISGITIAGPDAVSFQQTNSCGSTLAAGTSCSVSLIFTPTSTGPKGATLSFADNAVGSPQSVLVSGNGVSLGLTSTPGGSTSATVAAGAAASYSLSIGGAGFGGVATITCTGAPAGAVCSVPNSVNLSATSSSPLTVTVTTKPRSSATLFPNHTTWFLALAVFGLFALPGKPKNRLARWLNSMPLLLLMLVCSCGGGGSSVVTQPVQDGTPAGQYTLTLTASAGSNVQSLPLKLTVQ